jgi:hypothetical protein
MKIKRFNMFEAKSPETKALEEKITKFILGELKKDGLQRSDIIKKIENKFKDEAKIAKIARSVANNIVSDPLLSKENIKTKKDGKKVLFYIDNNEKITDKKDDKKDDKLKFGSPEWREKYVKTGKKSKNKVDRFDNFKEDEAKKAAEKDMNDVKAKKRNLNFSKDSTKQLETKLKSDKYKKYKFDIQDELDKRKEKDKKKDKKEAVVESKLNRFSNFKK